ncbi:MAG: B12-binding domain-containing protein [Candidatus Latescibacterota bacterium]|jgi:trimethylamine corrinoid protein
MSDFFEQCKDAVLKGDRDAAVGLAARAIAGEHDVMAAIDRGFSAGIRQAGELWEKGEYFLPELAFSAEVMKAAMETLRPALEGTNGPSKNGRSVVIGTVKGDIHDIGKSLVSTLLSANGFDVTDLGADVSHERFVDAARAKSSGLVCMSALLTTTMTGQGRVVELLRENGLRDRFGVLVGGAPTSPTWAEQIGADAWACDAVDAVRAANDWFDRHGNRD